MHRAVALGALSLVLAASGCRRRVENPLWEATEPACDPACEEPASVCVEGTCVECGQDDDCGPGLRCDPERLCVQCVEPADCPTSAPACALGTCVQCADDEDCPGQHCQLDEHVCVDCRDHADCTESGSPRCDDEHRCGPCTPEGDECGVQTCFVDDVALPDDDALAGHCVACNPSGAIACAGPLECDGATHECIAGSGDVAPCRSCRVDQDCRAEGKHCVQVLYPNGDPEAHLVGSYCAYDCPDDAFCGLNAGRGTSCTETLTRGGAPGTFCLPRFTTCESYLAHDEVCEDEAACGWDPAGGDPDGDCQPLAGGCGRCTLYCQQDDDCPLGATCNGVGRCTVSNSCP